MVSSALEWVKRSVKYNLFCHLELVPLSSEKLEKADSDQQIWVFFKYAVCLSGCIPDAVV